MVTRQFWDLPIRIFASLDPAVYRRRRTIQIVGDLLDRYSRLKPFGQITPRVEVQLRLTICRRAILNIRGFTSIVNLLRSVILTLVAQRFLTACGQDIYSDQIVAFDF